jgi:hypothetical protein
VVNDSALITVSPAQTAGVVDVIVTNPNGSNPVTAPGKFIYVPHRRRRHPDLGDQPGARHR